MLAAEQHTQRYNRRYGLPTTILRLTNVIMRVRYSGPTASTG
jgi:nucleoside-diphosphate-sugar epimerase